MTNIRYALYSKFCSNFLHIQNHPPDPDRFQLILRLSNFSLLGHLKSYSVANRMQKNCVSNRNRHQTVEQSNQSRGTQIRQKGEKSSKKKTEASTAWRAVLSPQKTTAMSIRQPLCKVSKDEVWDAKKQTQCLVWSGLLLDDERGAQTDLLDDSKSVVSLMQGPHWPPWDPKKVTSLRGGPTYPQLTSLVMIQKV